ncbi:MAG: DUF3347 domain-containing protein [Candidatus Aminicenantes bacterium]|nr:MAG: DUF3347 domain-containing protein [Candidatus Aminicenantes bacterium]
MRRVIFMILIISLGIGLWAGKEGVGKVSPAFTNYVAAQEALASDNLESAKNALELLAKSSKGELKKLTETTLKAKNLETLRQAFKPLSEWMVTQELPNGLAVAYCPMAKAHWVQKNGDVANPFYGSAMLRCGTIKKVPGKDK